MFQQISGIAKQYWYIVVGVVGFLLILGAVFQWKWVLQNEGEKPLGFLRWVRDIFGYGGYRFAIGAIGLLILVFAVAYPMLLAALQ